MVLFPEGGFLHKRLEVSQKYAAKMNFPFLKNVTLPRVGALKAIMEVIPPHTVMGNNNATAKQRTPENGTLRPFGSQGKFILISLFSCELTEFPFIFLAQSIFFNIKIRKMTTPNAQIWIMYLT